MHGDGDHMNLLTTETETETATEPVVGKTLDALLAEALSNTDTTRDTFVELWQKAIDAITAAKETIETESERALDLENADPDKSNEAVRVAKRTAERLSKATHKLKAKVDQIDAINYAEEWHERADEIAGERDKLAQELADLYPTFVTKLADLFARIDENKADIEHLHGYAPRGESRRLVDAELGARGLESYSAAQPRLRDNLKLPRFDRPIDVAFPEPPPLNPYAEVMLAHVRAVEAKQVGMFGPDWHEARKLVDEQRRLEIAARDAELARQAEREKQQYHQRLLDEDRRRRGLNGS